MLFGKFLSFFLILWGILWAIYLLIKLLVDSSYCNWVSVESDHKFKKSLELNLREGILPRECKHQTDKDFAMVETDKVVLPYFILDLFK